jgi:non-haem Fe2+, alpha-ketoglutarate-dependent halogenase
MTDMVETGSYRLTDDELAQFERDGFYGPVTIYEPDEIERRWREARVQLLDRSHAAYPLDEVAGATNIANYDRHLDIDFLTDHVCNPKIVDRVTSILGPDVLLWRTEFFAKYAGDEGTDWHQADTFANASGSPQILWPTIADSEIARGGTLTVWTAFTDATLVNGCLQLMPGTHKVMNYDESKRMEWNAESINTREKHGVKRGFFGYDYRQLQVDPDFVPDESKAVPQVMRRGQAIFFLSTLMHASLPHTGSKREHRLAFAARYVPTKVRVYPDTDYVEEYGGKISLERFGNVLVAGKDEYGFNKIVDRNLRGRPFPRPRS